MPEFEVREGFVYRKRGLGVQACRICGEVATQILTPAKDEVPVCGRHKEQEIYDYLHPADYKGFVLEAMARSEQGLPIDTTTLREMAERYNTPDLSGCEHSDSMYEEWEKDNTFLICTRCGAMKVKR